MQSKCPSGPLQAWQVAEFIVFCIHTLCCTDNSTSGGVVIIAVGGPLLSVWSAASNDVILASNFTSGTFTSYNLGSGKLIALAVLTGCTTVSNTGCTTHISFCDAWFRKCAMLICHMRNKPPSASASQQMWLYLFAVKENAMT